MKWFLVQTALTALQQLFAEAVRKEADKTDEIIRVFTDQQYEKLTQYQRRAQLDHEALVRYDLCLYIFLNLGVQKKMKC